MGNPNWFIGNPTDNVSAEKNFAKFLPELVGKKVAALQIGAYTGDATVWLFENLLNSHDESYLVDIDTWEGGDVPAYLALDWKSVEDDYDLKTKKYQESGKLRKVKSTSDEFFETDTDKYDFIYVDGDHAAASALKDGINAIKRIKPGGILAFDDYLWRSHKGPTYEPHTAIAAILTAFKDEFIVHHMGNQVWLKKL